MKLEKEFKFLNLQSVRRKEAEKYKPEEQFFCIVNFLDDTNNPVRFFSFNADMNSNLIYAVQNGKLVGLQDCLVNFELNCTNGNWNVSLKDVQYDKY